MFGDWYNGNRGIPRGVLEAMKKHVDVLSVQYYCEPNDTSRRQMVEDLDGWRKICGKPVLVVDIGNWCAVEMDPQRASGLKGQEEMGENYVKTLGMLMEQNWCVGYRWCGYIENKGGRGWGIVDPFDEPYEKMTVAVTEFSGSALERLK